MISIGNQFGGQELRGSNIQTLLSHTSNLIAEHRGGEWYGAKDIAGADDRPRPAEPYFEVGSEPAVNIVFHVPGSITDFPPLEAPQAGRFSRKQKLLLVNVYVPKEQVALGGSVDFVIDALRKSCAIAAEVFEKKKVGPFDLARANAIIERVRTRLMERTG
jgi:hypothetical protein